MVNRANALAIVVFGLSLTAVDLAILSHHRSAQPGSEEAKVPPAIAYRDDDLPLEFHAASSGGGGGTINSSSSNDKAAQGGAWDGSMAARNLLQTRPMPPGVVMRRPNYTLPACALARRDGPFRADFQPGVATDVNAAVTSTAPRQAPLRVLVMGMQSSGASTFLFLLAQIPGAVAVVDLWVGRPAPRPEDLLLSDEVKTHNSNNNNNNNS